MGLFKNKELIEYLQRFQEDSEAQIIVVDCHKERKYAFHIDRLAFITDEKFPVMFLDIDTANPDDLTSEVDESKKDEEEISKDEKTDDD